MGGRRRPFWFQILSLTKSHDALSGGKPTSALIIDESSFPKRGIARRGRSAVDRAAGQGRHCQVAVCGVRTDVELHTPIDMRLYLPKR